MYSNKKIIPIISVLIFIVISYIFPKNDWQGNLGLPALKEYSSEYFPVDPSLKLVYNSSFGEAHSVIKKKGNNYILDLRNDDFFFVQTVQVENDTVYLTKLDQEVDVFLFISAGVAVTYDHLYLRFPFLLKTKDNWR